MAKHGLLFERDPFIEKCINRAGIFTEDLDGGDCVVLDKVNANDKELYDVVKYTTGKRVCVLYNPSVKYDVINEKKFPAKSLDDRDYYNPKNTPFDMFIPEKDVVFGITGANIKEDDVASLEVGKMLKPEASTGKYCLTTASTGTGVDSTEPAFKIEEISSVKYPTGDFSDDKETVYFVRTIQN